MIIFTIKGELYDNGGRDDGGQIIGAALTQEDVLKVVSVQVKCWDCVVVQGWEDGAEVSCEHYWRESGTGALEHSVERIEQNYREYLLDEEA